MESEVAERLGRLLAVDASELSVTPLAGGISNRSFVVTGPRDKWAVRIPLATEVPQPLQTLDSAAEERLLAVVAGAGLGPEVLAYDANSQTLVTRYLAGAEAWTAEDARAPDNIRRIAGSLRRLHRLEIDVKLKPFLPCSLAQRYLEAAHQMRRDENAAADAEEQAWARELRRLAEAYETEFSPRTLCHNDLVAANILDDGRLWLVDFEYALLADPILDLASLAGMNGYDVSQQGLLVEAYVDTSPVPFGRQQLDYAVRLVRLLSYFWAVSRTTDTREPDEMRHFADVMAAMLR